MAKVNIWVIKCNGRNRRGHLSLTVQVCDNDGSNPQNFNLLARADKDGEILWGREHTTVFAPGVEARIQAGEETPGNQGGWQVTVNTDMVRKPLVCTNCGEDEEGCTCACHCKGSIHGYDPHMWAPSEGCPAAIVVK